MASSNEDFVQKLPVIQAIPDNDTMVPNTIPVDTYVQEAENLYHWCTDDREILTANGLDWTLAEDLLIRAGALRYAQSQWMKKRFNHKETERAWMRRSPEAYDYRNELIHTFRFAYRRKPDILGRVDTIADDYGHADMIQDLMDLAVLGKANTAPLEAINFDLTKLDTAETLADEMSELLGATTAERAESNEAVSLRNKAYTHLKEAVDEIKNYGQYLFWRDEERIRGYSSAYLKRKNNRSKISEENAAATAE